MLFRSVAVKLVGSGSYFGQALEASGGISTKKDKAKIMAFINPGYYAAGLSVDATSSEQGGVFSQIKIYITDRKSVV